MHNGDYLSSCKEQMGQTLRGSHGQIRYSCCFTAVEGFLYKVKAKCTKSQDEFQWAEGLNKNKESLVMHQK